MKILMLNPPYVDYFCRSQRWAAKTRGRAQRHPDWMLIATAVLEKAGHIVKFVDGAVLNLKERDVRNILTEFKPEMVVLHTTTPTIYNDILYARIAKEVTTARTVLIGTQVTAEPDNTFQIDSDTVDIIVRGEYDHTLRDLANGLSLEHIKGISYQKNREIIHNEPRPFLDVKELPFPAWHHIKPEWYYDAGKRHPFITLISGRGCFGLCTFCQYTHLMSGHKLRLRQAAQVVDEIVYDLNLFPYLKEIMFETDTFGASKRHAREVCEEILHRNVKITWSCNCRVDMDLSLLPLMKRAGCRMLMTGFEFGTQAALDAVKKMTTLEQSIKFAETAHKLGFIIHGCFMIGAPYETKEMAEATIKFARSLPLDTIQLTGICAFPGTPIYKWAKEHDYLVPKDWNEWVGRDYEQVTLLNYPQLMKEETDKYINRGLREFYLRPRQVIKMILNIRNYGDIKRKAYGLKSFADSVLKKQFLQ